MRRMHELLRESGVDAVVAAVAAAGGSFARVEQVGSVWVAWLDGLPWAAAESPRSAARRSLREDGWARIRIDSERAT